MKNLILTVIVMACPVFVSAQAVEVKGVTSRIVCYENCEEEENRKKTYGFEYENLNKFAVFVEAEKWRNTFCMLVGPGVNSQNFIADTKAFVLEPGEKYIWKVGLSGYLSDCDVLRKDGYYTVFKAFKN
jgi:hypothetical protein